MADNYEVTFYFTSVTSTVEVSADSDEEAWYKARHKEVGTPVPTGIPYKTNMIQRGGARAGSGAKRGRKRTTNPRILKKTVLWSVKEWEMIVGHAEEHFLNVSDLQREAVMEYIK